jgi:hypothetical protein
MTIQDETPVQETETLVTIEEVEVVLVEDNGNELEDEDEDEAEAVEAPLSDPYVLTASVPPPASRSALRNAMKALAEAAIGVSFFSPEENRQTVIMAGYAIGKSWVKIGKEGAGFRVWKIGEPQPTGKGQAKATEETPVVEGVPSVEGMEENAPAMEEAPA